MDHLHLKILTSIAQRMILHLVYGLCLIFRTIMTGVISTGQIFRLEYLCRVHVIIQIYQAQLSNQETEEVRPWLVTNYHQHPENL